METQPIQSFESVMEKALQASALDDTQTALVLFKTASEIEPTSAIPHFLMAAEYMELSQIEQAEAAYASALVLNPSLHIARFQLGLLFATTNRNPMALMTWSLLLTLEDNNPLRLFAEGLAAVLANEPTQAISLIEKGIAANTQNLPLNQDMQRILAKVRTESKIDAPLAAAELTPVVEEESNALNHHFLLNQYKRGSLH